jgi:predicted nucleic acid-binding protein
VISFVDTSFFFALASADDPDHERVREVFDQIQPQELPGTWLTTNHVVLETIRLTKRNIGNEAAVEMGRRLYAEQLARIHWTTPAEEKQALDYLAKYNDQRYSPVDCISFVVMEQLDIDEALTGDHHYAQAGFTPLLKPSDPK